MLFDTVNCGGIIIHNFLIINKMREMKFRKRNDEIYNDYKTKYIKHHFNKGRNDEKKSSVVVNGLTKIH